MQATPMIPSADDIIAHQERFEGAVCVNDIIASVAREQRGNIKRMSQDTDIPYQTIQSWLERQDDGSYRRGPDADRLIRLMTVSGDILAGVLFLVRKQEAACQSKR